jgi:hypothetical protein
MSTIRTKPMSRRHLAACIAAAFALTAFVPECFAAYDNVQNCNDTGSGSLRATIANAAENDTIILNPTNMHCSVVTLGSEIVMPQNDLTVKYNADNQGIFTVSANSAGRAFDHTGTGTLKIQRLQIKYGKVDANNNNAGAYGGCIRSAGTIDLESSIVRNCTITGAASLEAGGGIYAAKGLILKFSAIKNNSLNNTYKASAGAGVFVQRYLAASYSTISGNTLKGTYSSGTPAVAGGSALNFEYVKQPSKIDHCTISGNLGTTGAIYIFNPENGNIALTDSTISGNSTSSESFSAITSASSKFYLGIIDIYNSTIAFNLGQGSKRIGPLHQTYYNYSTAVVADAIVSSSIIANNTAYISGLTGSQIKASDILGTILGSNSIIRAATSATTLPPDTIGADPLLLPLANNGGPTQTHAFRDGSPAFGNGNNNGNFSTDQRGSGFPRAVNGATDIGAFQLQVRDVVFASGFD